MTGEASYYDAGCTCKFVRFRMTGSPLFVHCCHCYWCQRESGSAFALNAIIEADRVELLKGDVEAVATPSASGRGQKISRCPACRIALWSNYSGAGDAIRFVRIGTLDEPGRLSPDIHIFTASKQPWVALSPDIPAVPEYYRASEYWPKASLERRAQALATRPTAASGAVESAPFRSPDLSDRPFSLTVERDFSMPAPALYLAWTERFDVWFAAHGSVLMRPAVDAAFFFETEFKLEHAAAAKRHPHYGRFLRLTANRLVELTWVTGAGGTDGAETIVTIELKAASERTHLKLTHAGFASEAARDRHRSAWPSVLDRLERTMKELEVR